MQKLPNTWKEIQIESELKGEDNDCSVKAAAILCEVPYEQAHAAFEKAGRVFRKRTVHEVKRRGYYNLGYFIRWISLDEVRPKRGGHVTSYHPQRFPELWDKFIDQRLLLSSNTHDMAFDCGTVMCWAGNRSLRIREIWAPEKR